MTTVSDGVAVRGEGRRSGRGGGRGRGERAVVPRAEPTSYYGRAILKPTPWEARDIAGYLFLGGLAGASSVLGAGAAATGRPALARTAKTGAAMAISLGLAALAHDLGRPGRFINMLRVVKPTSPMSMGSWLLAAYAPAAAVSAASALTGRARPLGATATAGAALLGPAVATYTAVLFADTAVPAWHEAYREMPFLFAGSAAAAAGGLGMVGSPLDQAGPARTLAAVGALVELTAARAIERRLGDLARPFREGRGGARMRAAKVLGVTGLVLGCGLGRRSRAAAVAGGAALLVGSALTRFGVFQAGLDSAADPSYVVGPQRRRLDERDPGASQVMSQT